MQDLDEVRDAETATRPGRDGLGLITARRLRSRAAAPCRHVSPGFDQRQPHDRALPALSRRKSVEHRVPDRERHSRSGYARPHRCQGGLHVQAQTHLGLRTHASHVELHPEEVGALAKSFPSLKSTIEANPNLFAEVHSAAREIDRAVEVQADEWTDRVARVEAVEASDAGTILTRKNAIIQTIIAVVTGLGGFALALPRPAYSPVSIPSRPIGSMELPWSGCSGVCCSISVWLLCFALPDVSVHAATDAARL